MLKYPSLNVQKIALKNLSQPSPIDQWQYAVSKTWMENFRTHLTTEDDLSPKDQLKPMYLEPGIEGNEFISEKWWNIMVTWYGWDKDCEILRKPLTISYAQIMNGNGQCSVLTNKDTDFLTVETSLMSNLGKSDYSKTLTMYAWESFGFLEKQIRKHFKIPIQTKCRLWLNLQDDGEDVVLDAIDIKTEAVLSKMASYLPWLAQLLKKRDKEGANKSKTLSSDPFSLNSKKMKVRLVLEPFAMSSKEQIGECNGWLQNSQSSPEIDSEVESIVTFATINNQWEEEFTNIIDELSKEFTEVTTEKRTNVIQTAREIVNEKVAQTNDLKDMLEEKVKRVEEKETELTKREENVRREETELKQRLGQYKEGLESFMKEKTKIEAEWRRVREQNIIQDSQIALNIGGMKFSTSLSTVTGIDDSLFVSLFCGTHVVTPSSDGSYFFDRDGTHFRHILNYLRNGPKAISSFPNDCTVLNEVLNEAQYYMLNELQNLIQEKIERSSLNSVSVGDMEYVSYSSYGSR